MIVVRIINEIELGECDFGSEHIAPYSSEKWGNGTEYKFDCLKDAGKFVSNAVANIKFDNEIDFNAETKSTFNSWNWGSVTVNHAISPEEDNTILLYISAELEYFD